MEKLFRYRVNLSGNDCNNFKMYIDFRPPKKQQFYLRGPKFKVIFFTR